MSKKVYLSFLLHGNMCYDRYTKHEIREKFPVIYATGLHEIRRFPQVTAHIDFPGLTTLSLKHHAPWFIDELKPLIANGQVIMVGCQYGASHAMCSDEESDIIAGRVSMEILRDELQPNVSTFFPQEIAFHSQLPFVMTQIGARRIIVAPPERWLHPKRIKGMDGSHVDLYPLDQRFRDVGKLEELYDAAEDGDFVLTGGDFEMLGNIEAYVRKIDELTKKGKTIEWTTVERYEREVGVSDEVEAPGPVGYTSDDTLASPSFSRWVSHPEDPAWHAEAVRATDALRTAGFAKAAAAQDQMDAVDAPWQERWTSEPDNPWSHHFEDATEFPETEPGYLTNGSTPTLLSRAWHHLLIGLNSDASGWAPWTPRTRHRKAALRTSHALAQEVIHRFAQQLAGELAPFPGDAEALVLALNPAPARTVELTIPTPRQMSLLGADGGEVPGTQRFRDGAWSVTTRVKLPPYGYTLFGLATAAPSPPSPWCQGNTAEFAGWRVELESGDLMLSGPGGDISISIPPFRISDPSGTAATEDIAPNWDHACTRTRKTPQSHDLEVFTEVAWAVWVRLVISLHADHAQITAEVSVDQPRRIGNLGTYNPEGLLLQFKGQPGRGVYDIPYATVTHPTPAPSFIAAQRFVGLESTTTPFGLIALGGDQSFKVDAADGTIAASLGASIKGRPDLRPECRMLPDGTAEHKLVSGGDQFFGTQTHRFALAFGDRTKLATAAHQLRTGTPVVHVAPGTGSRPLTGSLFDITPKTVRATAFRTNQEGIAIVLNNLAPETTGAQCNGHTTELPAYGTEIIRLDSHPCP